MKQILAIPIVMTCVLGAVDLRAQVISVPYDTFMRLDDNERLQKFQELTPANRAAVVQEHVIRWRHVYADRLTPEQDQLLADIAQFIRPEFYDGSRHSDEFIAAFSAIERRISKAFTTDEARNAFTIHGPYLPPQ